MKRLGLQGVRRGKVVRTTISDMTAARPLDRVNRQFRADRPNQLWISDFTYVSTWQGWQYVAFVIDVYARRIVGWRQSSSMRTDFVLDALEQALYDRQPQRDDALIHHSDRGSQYVSIRYSEQLAEAGIEPSVGSRGDSYDNALAETINGLYKAELIHRRAPWKTKESLAYSGERDRRFRQRDRDSGDRDRWMVLRDLILWPSCFSAVFPFLVCGLNNFIGPCQAAGGPRQGLTQSLSAGLRPIDF